MRKKSEILKKMRIKIIITAICMVAILSVMFIGVSAGKVERLRVNSIVNIPAKEVNVDILGYVNGVKNKSDILATYTDEVKPDEVIEPWKIGDMQFEDSGEVPIVITIIIKNLDIRPLELAFMIPPEDDRLDMEYKIGSSMIEEEIIMSEKIYNSETPTKVESTKELRVLDERTIASGEYYKIEIKMSVVDVKKDFSKIDRNFALTMAVEGRL